MGPGERDAQKHGNYDFTSIHLSQIDIFYHKTFSTDIAFLEVSLPDNDGNMSFGATGVAMDKYVLDTAKTAFGYFLNIFILVIPLS